MMKTLLVILLLFFKNLARSEEILQNPLDFNTAWGYLERYGIPEAEKIRKAEEEFVVNNKIVGGMPAELGEYVYQAGLLSSIIGLAGVGVCGGSLISANRVLTAAHCWFDGVNQAWRFEIVLGSTTLFSGGTRMESSVIAIHPDWSPILARNDVAVIYLPNSVAFSDTIGPIALPSGNEINETFAGSTATVSGFGQTYDGAAISINQLLSHVSLNVITNEVCSETFPLVLHASNVCTSGSGGVGPCRGDSGGPLALNGENGLIVIGIASFVSALGCQAGFPAVYARVTSFTSFINQHI